MGLILEAIEKYGNNLNNCFVFPSKIAARQWFIKALEITKLPTIPEALYIAWDTFKEEHFIYENNQKLKPAETVTRLLYAAKLMERNAEGAKYGQPFFSKLIPAEYGKNSVIFTKWIAGILPQLDHFEKLIKQYGIKEDDEDKDILKIKYDYSLFLKKQGLFEPSWISSGFLQDRKKYIIIFPELIEDFSEYAKQLYACPDIICINIAEPENSRYCIREFPDSRKEIKYIISEIEELLLSGFPANEIAVSAGALKDIKPYLKREFDLRGIPADFRTGGFIAENQAGSLFAMLFEVYTNNYSFSSLKTLLLNKHIPWKYLSLIDSFINFGIKNHCAVSWFDDGIMRNVWFEAFKVNEVKTEEIYRIEQWFKAFSQGLEKIVTASNFSELRRNYFSFRSTFIDSNAFTETDEAVLSTAVTLLIKLEHIEETFSEYMPKDCYKLFLDLLKTEIYVAQTSGQAVSVFPYGIAATGTFKRHFVINLNQDTASVIYNKLPFLQNSKKKLLKLTSTEASNYFVFAYTDTSSSIFSYAKKTYSGYAMVHNCFTQIKAVENAHTEDSFHAESEFFKKDAEKKSSLSFSLYPVQKNGFFCWNKIAGYDGTYKNFEHKSLSATSCSLDAKLDTVQYKNGMVCISATDLKKFFTCKKFWLYEKIFGISFEDFDAEIFNPRRAGNMYHYVLEAVYKKICRIDGRFLSCNKTVYTEWAYSEIKKITGNKIELKGPLAKPFIESMTCQIIEAIEYVFSFDKEYFDGCRQIFIETPLEYEEGGLLYNGKIDRAIETSDSAVILDYKTNKPPAFSCYNVVNDMMTDFQIPMYVLLLENKLKIGEGCTPISSAFFINLTGEDFTPIIKDGSLDLHNKKNGVNREDFENRLAALKNCAHIFESSVREKDFVPVETSWRICGGCIFKKICRTTYTVRGL